MASLISEIISRRHHSHVGCESELVGKTRFVLCPIFGRVGAVCLQPLYDLARTVTLSASTEVMQCLVFLREAVRLVKPVNFPLLRVLRTWRMRNIVCSI